MKRKIIHLAFSDEQYYLIKELAKKDHLKVSTWVKQKLLRLLNSK